MSECYQDSADTGLRNQGDATTLRFFVRPVFRAIAPTKVASREYHASSSRQSSAGVSTALRDGIFPKRVGLCCHRERKSITCKLKTNGNESRFRAFRTENCYRALDQISV